MYFKAQLNTSTACRSLCEKNMANSLRVQRQRHLCPTYLLFHIKIQYLFLTPVLDLAILSVALIERLQNEPSISRVDVVCYENDPNILELLQSNLDWACKHSNKTVSFQIITDNYILSQMSDYNYMLDANPNPRKYDLVIGNPPYMKIAKDAPEAVAMPDVCYGAPNLYFLFAAMSLFNLQDEGEMVYIIPRSWTSGAYFKCFRQEFLHIGALEHIHLFVSRDKAVFQNTQRTSRRGRYQWGNTNLFWGQSSPDKVITAYNRIISEGIGYEALKSQGYRNAIEALVAARAITKNGDDFVIRCSLEQVFKNIEETETIKFAQEKIAENPEIKSESMGLLLADQFSRKWTPASQKRYGNAMILWVKYLNNLTQM